MKQNETITVETVGGGWRKGYGSAKFYEAKSKCRGVNEEANTPTTTSNLYVANCGPAVGLSYDTIASVFGRFGDVEAVYAADDSGTRVVVSYSQLISAQAAFQALNGLPCPDLAGRFLHFRYSVLRPTSQNQFKEDFVPVSLVASELNIPGLHLLLDFVSAEEEQALLEAVDDRPWKNLAKRRVQHYECEFCYETRNVNTKQQLGELPSFVSPILERISLFPIFHDSANIVLDQLTVNEYPPGVGLSPHVDTHSAFEGLIFSLSLAGPCIMEFRRYPDGSCFPKVSANTDIKAENLDSHSNFVRKSIYLPPRSMLLLSGEARYAWHRYISHHKVDIVNDSVVRRHSRRVSFTLFLRCVADLVNVILPNIVIPRSNRIHRGNHFRL